MFEGKFVVREDCAFQADAGRRSPLDLSTVRITVHKDSSQNCPQLRKAALDGGLPQGITNPICKESPSSTALSGKFDYLQTPVSARKSATSEFFTDDKFGSIARAKAEKIAFASARRTLG